MVDVGLATSAAPTYFPSHGLGGRALSTAACSPPIRRSPPLVEALKRRDEEPHDLGAGDLLLVSLGTGQHETGHRQSQVRRWGRIGWIWPRRQDPALIAAFLDGQSDAADHWAEILLNHEPGGAALRPGVTGGRTPLLPLPDDARRVSTPLDDASPRALSSAERAGRPADRGAGRPPAGGGAQARPGSPLPA